MKKGLLLVTLVLAFAIIAGCGKKEEQAATNGSSNNGTNVETTQNGSNDLEVGYTSNDEYVTFSVRKDFDIKEDGWLGIIPTGTIYEKEVDADDVDMCYAYASNYYEENIKSYLFEFSKEYIGGIEDGIYDMVLCSSDDGEVGVVLFQIGFEKKGDKYTLDYENKK